MSLSLLHLNSSKPFSIADTIVSYLNSIERSFSADELEEFLYVDDRGIISLTYLGSVPKVPTGWYAGKDTLKGGRQLCSVKILHENNNSSRETLKANLLSALNIETTMLCMEHTGMWSDYDNDIRNTPPFKTADANIYFPMGNIGEYLHKNYKAEIRQKGYGKVRDHLFSSYIDKRRLEDLTNRANIKLYHFTIVLYPKEEVLYLVEHEDYRRGFSFRAENDIVFCSNKIIINSIRPSFSGSTEIELPEGSMVKKFTF